MKESKFLNVLILVLKILLITVLAASFIFFTYSLISAHIDSIEMQNTPSDGTIRLDPFPITFVVVLIFSLITNGACMLFSLVGLIVSVLYKVSPKKRRNVTSFIVLLITPVILEIFYLAFYFIAS